MSDAQTRAALEHAQMEIRRLTAEVARLPPMSEERRAARALHEQLAGEVLLVARALEAEHANEVRLRDELDRAQGTKWWKSPFAPFAATAGVIGGFALALEAVDHFNWAYWSQHLALPLLAVPVVVNAGRWARARWRRRRPAR